jgi:hypothetical protein
MAGKQRAYDPDRDCENDAAFHLYWQDNNPEKVAQLRGNEDGVIGWAKTHHPEKHAMLASAFKAAVKEILG